MAEQTSIRLSEEDKQTLEKIKFELKGSSSQVFRLGLYKLSKEILKKENGTTI